MRKLFLLSSAMYLLSGCFKEAPKAAEPKTGSFNNFEPNEWTGASFKNSDNAHSGKTVAFIDSASMYSTCFLNVLENICNTNIDSVTFSYWIFLKDGNAKAKTVLSIDNPADGKNVFWSGVPVEEKIKEYNKWMKVSETFAIPKNTDSKNTLKLYVWNNCKEEILLDDFKIDFY